MQKLLVPIDGSEASKRVVQYLISLVRTLGPVELFLINVQPRIDGNVRMFVSKETIDEYHREEGEKALAAAKKILDDAKVAYTSGVHIGNIAEVVVGECKKNQCTGIVMGTRGMGGVMNLVMGSVASQVLHLADVPVTFIK